MGSTEQHIGLLVIFAGFVLIIIGLITWYGGFSWLGNLPGDISIQRENFRVYIPLTSMILLSGLLTLIINFLNKIFE